MHPRVHTSQYKVQGYLAICRLIMSSPDQWFSECGLQTDHTGHFCPLNQNLWVWSPGGCLNKSGFNECGSLRPPFQINECLWAFFLDSKLQPY